MNAKIYNGNVQPNHKEFKIWVNDEGTIKTWNGTEWIENVSSEGSGGGSSDNIPQDGKTRLFISIAADGRMDFPLNFTQSVSKGVTVDWGDGSTPQTYSEIAIHAVHKYANIGDYVIVLDAADGCELGLGDADGGRPLIGDPYNTHSDRAYISMLKKVIISDNITSIGVGAFAGCTSLSSVIIPNSVTNIGENAFGGCNLSSIIIPNNVTSIEERTFEYCNSLTSIIISDNVASIGKHAFSDCNSLTSIIIPNSVTSIGTNAFNFCISIAYYDFSSHTSVPSLGTYVFGDIADDCSIIVPDNLYDQWISADNWSEWADYIVKKSDFDNGITGGSSPN